MDRCVCKNRSRNKEGGCNALHSLLPHNRSILGMPQRIEFDAELPVPLQNKASKQCFSRRTATIKIREISLADKFELRNLLFFL